MNFPVNFIKVLCPSALNVLFACAGQLTVNIFTSAKVLLICFMVVVGLSLWSPGFISTPPLAGYFPSPLNDSGLYVCMYAMLCLRFSLQSDGRSPRCCAVLLRLCWLRRGVLSLLGGRGSEAHGAAGGLRNDFCRDRDILPGLHSARGHARLPDIAPA